MHSSLKHMHILGVYYSVISSNSFTVRVKVLMSLCEDSASGLLQKRQVVAVFALAVTVG